MQRTDRVEPQEGQGRLVAALNKHIPVEPGPEYKLHPSQIIPAIHEISNNEYSLVVVIST
jgi:hypothetical protein